ncbi:MAG: IclR family transcriptional regulator [Limnochordia bacterium]
MEQLSKAKGEEGTNLVRSVDRAMQILTAFNQERTELSLTELVDLLGLSKSTLHRLIGTLTHWRCLELNPRSGKYRLGLRLHELGSLAILARGLLTEAEPYLKELVNIHGETASISVLDGGETVIVDKYESQAALRLTSQIGRRSPAYASASGKVLLAYQPPKIQEEIIAGIVWQPFTSRTITDPDLLKEQLVQVKARGYAIDDEEYQEELICIGAPVFDHSGSAVAALVISGLAPRVRQKGVDGIAATLMQFGRQISRSLGYQNHGDD